MWVELVKQLRSILGSDAVLSEVDELLVYDSDGLPQHKFLPGAVVFPGSTQEVAGILRILHEAKMPFTARGAGTGISGGAVATDRGAIIEMARMRRVLTIDPENHVAVIEVGLVNKHLTRAAEPFNLFYAPDPSSQSACTIGGNIAENAGGSHCLKYGVTVDHVLALKVVLSGGEVVDLGNGLLTPGYDLVGVFVGSEGTFGIATEAIVQLLPTPAAVRTILIAFPDVNEASRAVSAIIAAGLVPAALEMMDAAIIRAVEASIYAAGLPLDAEAALLIELDGLEAGLDYEASLVETICREHGAKNVRHAKDEPDRQKIWMARKGAFGVMGRISPDVMIQDAVVPRSRLPEVLASTYKIASKYDLLIANVFHAGDGNLHPLLSFDSSEAGQVERVQQAGREIMEICVAAGGSITGEHGVGLDKIDYLPLIFSDDDMDLMLRVRRAFDPTGLCNPGKVIPIRNGCGEKRAAVEAGAAGVSSETSPASGGVSQMKASPSAYLVPPMPGGSSNGTSKFDPENAGRAGGQIVGEKNIDVAPETSSITAFPGSVAEVSELLKLAESERWAVIPAGGGTWPDVGNPVWKSELTISTKRLTQFIEHEPADLVATVEAGVKLNELNSRLGNQWLPLDPPDDGRATVGGVVATGLPGAQAFGYSAPRHHVIGMRVALSDGRIIKAGGRVVKNVAGYDLCKLLVGSYGTLGLIVELTFKLRPRPMRQTTIVSRSADLSSLLEASKLILGLNLMPVALELLSPNSLADESDRYSLMVRFAGVDDAVLYQIKAAQSMLSELKDLDSSVVSDDAHLWSDLAAIPVRHVGPLIWRAAVPRINIEKFLTAMQSHGHSAVRWQASVGNGRVRVEEDALGITDENIHSLEMLRQTAIGLGGSLVIESAPVSIKERMDAWGYAGNALGLMRRIKAEFDGANRFSPGRFVNGI